MHKYKIAFVVGGLPFGGVETLLLETVKELRSLGHVPVVINISGTGELDAEFRKNGFETLSIGKSTKILKTTCFKTSIALRQLIKDINPDIIHTAHFSAHYHTRIAALGLKTPVITHCHNTKREKKFSRRLADRLLSFRTDRHVAVAQAVVEQGVAPYNWANRPCDILYNAINPQGLEAVDEVNLNELGVGTGPILFSVCRLVTQKKMDLLIEVTAQLSKVYPDLNLLIVGEGPERKRLEALVQNAGLSDKVVFAGFRLDVPGIMKSLAGRKTLFAMPSEFEGFGIAPLEGFYFGIPAVVSPFVPILEIAESAVKIVELDAERMASTIRSLIDDETDMAAMKKAAKAVASQYTIALYVERLLKIYGKVM